jgi:hypothetical protein
MHKKKVECLSMGVMLMLMLIIIIKVKQSRYRPGEAQSVPGSYGFQIS